MNYLKAGIGDPCAGQVMENIRLFMTPKVPKVSEEVGNMGLADPIGSKMPLYREFFLFYWINGTNTAFVWTGYARKIVREEYKPISKVDLMNSNRMNFNWIVNETIYIRRQPKTRTIFSDKTTKFEIYLKEGIGNPWAGHVNATPVPSFLVKPENSTMEENLGFADPTGSIWKWKCICQL